MKRYWVIAVAGYVLLLGMALFLMSCASDLTAEEREYRRIEMEIKWRLCEQVYRRIGTYTVHRDHTHERRVPPRPWMIQQDLADNNCHVLLKRAGLWQ